MSMRRHTTFLGKLESALPWVGGGLILLLLLGGGAWWLLVRRPADDANRPVDRADPAIVQLLDESRALERQYQRAVELGQPSESDVAGLRRSIALLQQWMKATDDHGDAPTRRLAAMRAALDEFQARAAIARSVAAEQSGRELFAAGQREPAIAKLTEALAAQREANSIPGAAGLRDLPREGRLGQEVERLRADPVVAELNDRLSAAQERLRASDWNGARREFLGARELQVRINREFPRTQFADIAALDRIESELESLNAADLMNALQALEIAANAKRQAGDFEGAGAALVEALELQKRINREFPRSRFASAERLDALEVARQTALSEPLINQLVTLDRTVTAALREGRVREIAKPVADATALGETVLGKFPRSRLLEGAARLKFNYLALLGGQLESVVEWTRGQFLPVPGVAGVRMLRTEVSQRLYARVMNSNPSRNPGLLLPVDSVPLADAQEFCRRLTWVLGREIRLPKEGEFRAAVGVDVPAHTAAAWAAESGAQKTRATDERTDATEFSDLLGNVAEWLQPADPASEAGSVAGGSYADGRAVLAGVPVQTVSRTERSRTVGFRVVVLD